MANQYLKLRRSSVPGKVPDTASLDFGEIALNTYDGLAFMKKDGSNGIEVVSIGSNQGAFTGSFSGSFVGNLEGTSSWANNSISSSYAVSASYTFNTISASYAYTASSAEKSFSAISASYAYTASSAEKSFSAISASYAYTASSAEKSFSSISSSYAYTASSSEKSFSSISSSNAATASSADNFIVRGNITGSNAIFTGTVTAQNLIVQTISSSVIYSSGSNIFGDELTDRQTFTGSVNITGSLRVNQDPVIVSAQTSSMSVLSASYATNTLTASYVHPLRQTVIISGSLLQGFEIQASGVFSHAEGYYTRALGTASHAEGSSTTAQGNDSHAEGLSSIAIGEASHAEGVQTSAEGYGSHAEGQTTYAIGHRSHAEGVETSAQGYGSHAEGYYATAQGEYSHAEGKGYQVKTTVFNPGNIHPNIAAGAGSHAEGASTFARGDQSHAAGLYSTASGLYSNAIGAYNTAGELSNAEGNKTNAGYFEKEAYFNVSIVRRPSAGSSTIQLAIMGFDAFNSGTPYIFTSSFQAGDKVVFKKVYYPTYNTSSGAIGTGVMSESIDYYVGTVNSSLRSAGFTLLQFTDMVIEDLPSWYTISSAYNTAFPPGYIANITRPINLSSFTASLGDFINESGSYYLPIGVTDIDSSGSFVGAVSHTEGRKTLSRGIYNHAEGHYTTASGHFSHAEGYYTITNAPYQHVQGQFNITSSAQSAFIIGNGTSISNRSNLVHAAGTQFQITGSLIVTGSITGSLFGTASWALNFLTGSVTSASYAATASLAVSSSYALTASHVNNLDLFRVFTGSVEAKVDVNPDSIFLIKSGSINFLNISSSGNTTLSSDLFIVKNLTTQQPVLTVSQSVVKIATQSLDPSGTTDAGSIWFTSTAMYIGLE